MTFIPKQPEKNAEVPYFEDVLSTDGWQGHNTGKSIETLKSEVIIAINRLGGNVTTFQEGAFQVDGKERVGYRVEYVINAAGGLIVPGRIDIAALPVRQKYSPRVRYNAKPKNREEQSLKMCLFMFRNSLEGAWFLQQLSPGYSPLIPFMIMDNDLTVSQIWNDGNNIKQLTPPVESEFIEGEVINETRD